MRRTSSLVPVAGVQAAPPVSDIQVSNGEQQARITLSFIGEPEYAYSQTETYRGAGISGRPADSGPPLQFSGNNLVKTIRAERRKTRNLYFAVSSIRRKMVKPEAVKRQNGGNYAGLGFQLLMPMSRRHRTTARRRERV